MGKLRIIKGNISYKELIPLYDVIINPTNPKMRLIDGISNIIFNRVTIKRLNAYINKKYHIINNPNNYMKEGDIRITPGFNIGPDIMFIRIPINDKENSLEQLISFYRNILNSININDYKDVLIPDLALEKYGYTYKSIKRYIHSLIKDFIKDKDINIDVVYNKMYFD